jgi:8-oxo-dGTP pyrophosphatase MutT (NUDIX family)
MSDPSDSVGAVSIAPVHPVDVFLLLTRPGRVLMALRRDTGYADGLWNLPSGKLEPGEDALSGVIREAREEIGSTLPPARLRLATTVHHRAADERGRIGLVFTAQHDPAAHGTPVNAEPHKCAGVDWFDIAALPAETTAYTADCVRAFLDGTPFALSGWPPATEIFVPRGPLAGG